MMRGVGASMLWQEWQQIDEELVDVVHQAGGTVIAWTVNELGDLDRMVRLGVAGPGLSRLRLRPMSFGCCPAWMIRWSLTPIRPSGEIR